MKCQAGNQSWIFIGRTVFKLKLQYFGHMTPRTDSEKTLNAGKDKGRRRRGWQRMRWWMTLLTQWSWGWARSGRWWRTGKPGMLPSMVSHQVAKRSTSGSSSVLPDAEYSWMHIQDWFPLGLTGFNLLAVKGILKNFSQHHSSKVPIFSSRPLWSNSHIHTWLLEKNIALTRQTFVGKVMPLLFNMCLGWS